MRAELFMTRFYLNKFRYFTGIPDISRLHLIHEFQIEIWYAACMWKAKMNNEPSLVFHEKDD